MTRIDFKSVRCIKCGKISTQSVVYSINTNLGTKKTQRELMKAKQECPNCGYIAKDISKKRFTFLKK
ncbi:MAG: hypothetical protein E7170_00585 [Firmicutes bacterium]|nr:hypothetical protein [Bacillota bacterium]